MRSSAPDLEVPDVGASEITGGLGFLGIRVWGFLELQTQLPTDDRLGEASEI